MLWKTGTLHSRDAKSIIQRDIEKEYQVRVLVHEPSRCTGCHICEETCSETWFKVVDRGKSRIQILEADEAGVYRAITCTQCGECIDVCPTQALYRARNGVVRMHEERCVGCLSCVGFCPIWAMRTHRDFIEPFKCVACGSCARACPEDALSVQDLADAEPSQTERWAERVAG
jgi:carbon-monoxide dehydrogenase iron sulfur subunit